MKKTSSSKIKCNEKICALVEKAKPYRHYILVAVIAFILGIIINSLTTSPAKINEAAIVDVQKLINNTPAVQELQTEVAKKQEDLQKWVQEAQAKINRYKEGTAKRKLVADYETEFAQKQQAMQQEYNEKLSKIDHKVTKIIKKAAKSDGYGSVLAKSSVISGGTDITDEIIEILK